MFHFLLPSDEQANLKKDNSLRLIWLHGWGHSHKSLLMLADYFKNIADNLLLDFAGFGNSPEPDEPWSAEDYADRVMNIIEDLVKSDENKKNILISHSFGGRVAIQMAAKYPNEIAGIVLISGAGLKAKRSFYFKTKAFIIKYLAKLIRAFPWLKRLPIFGKMQFGSADYRNASVMMKKILVKAVNEDLSAKATKIKCPALLIYGSEDTETPSYFGEKYSKLIKNSSFVEIPSQGHNSILIEGRHQLENLIEDFIKGLKQ